LTSPHIQRTVKKKKNPRDPTMSLNFPNPSRSYDAFHHCVNFWGYDNAREIAFTVNNSVISNLSPSAGSDEPAVLAAFDRHRDQILSLARGLYSGGSQNRYTIS
jgi:hypothetical protein